MFLLRRPTEEQIRQFLIAQQDKPFSYPDPGLTGWRTPGGYKVDHHRVRLGTGQEAFNRGVEALKRWEMFNFPWLHLCWPNAPIETATVVGVLAQVGGIWWLNACRIVYVIDEEGEVRRYGFAYGTLPEHVERGQESFAIEWNIKDDSVWYEIFAYSKPHHLLAKLGYPIVRSLQKRFARHSMEAMVIAAGMRV